MNNTNFSTTFVVSQSPEEVFKAISNVRAWWTENVNGETEHQGDEFSVQFWDVHYSKQKLIEVVPNAKVVWLLTDSKLTFAEDESEWTGNKIIFDITPRGAETEVRFTQVGLTPTVECFTACSGAWSGYLNNSLKELITTGKGKPTTLAELGL